LSAFNRVSQAVSRMARKAGRNLEKLKEKLIQPDRRD
jgi:hypothetical protein